MLPGVTAFERLLLELEAEELRLEELLGLVTAELRLEELLGRVADELRLFDELLLAALEREEELLLLAAGCSLRELELLLSDDERLDLCA